MAKTETPAVCSFHKWLYIEALTSSELIMYGKHQCKFESLFYVGIAAHIHVNQLHNIELPNSFSGASSKVFLFPVGVDPNS
jgi:hypothetical protein